jgi:ribosomal protein S18 acetylase RimI-like enzyme
MADLAVLGVADAAAAAGALARAFADSPVYQAVLSTLSEDVRPRALLRVKRGFVSAMAHHGESRVARVGGTLAGTTLVTAPGAYPLSWLDEIRQAAGCATTGPTAIVRFLKVTAYMRSRHITEPHFSLFAIGVEPAQQGRGIGKALLAELNARADAAGAPCYLETEKAINVRLYESVGYRVLTDALIPGLDNVRMWTMARPAA